MQPELKQLIQRRDRKLGLTLLGLLAAVVLVAAALLYPMLDRPGGRWDLRWGSVMTGTIFGVACTTLAWFALGNQPLLQRSAVLLAMAILVAGTWFGGYLAVTQPSTEISNTDLTQALASLPVAIFGALVPLIAFRILANQRLAIQWDDSQSTVDSSQWSVLDLLVMTGLVAILIGAIMQSQRLQADWRMLLRFNGFLFGISFGFSAGVLIPTSYLLYSRRYSFLVTGLATLLAFCAAGFAACATPLINDWSLAVLLFASAAVSYLWGTCVLRLLGYRLPHPGPVNSESG